MAQRDFVTIVSGLPRSGTSMMMRMISEGGVPALIDEIRKADEDNPKGYYEFEPVKKTKEDASWLDDASGKVVKMVYRLLFDLPDTCNYRVIFMRRNLDEVLKSQEVMLERSGKGGGGLSDDKLKQLFTSEMEKAAKHMTDKSNFEYIEVSYNEILEDAAPWVAKINTFLGGDLDAEKMQGVVDRALYRQRK